MYRGCVVVNTKIIQIELTVSMDINVTTSIFKDSDVAIYQSNFCDMHTNGVVPADKTTNNIA